MKNMIVDSEELVILTEDDQVLDAILEFPEDLKKYALEILSRDVTKSQNMAFKLTDPPVYILMHKAVIEGDAGLILVSSREKKLLYEFFRRMSERTPESKHVTNVFIENLKQL